MKTTIDNIGNDNPSARITISFDQPPIENHGSRASICTCQPFAYNTPAAITDTNINNVDTIAESHINRLGISRHSTHDTAGIASASSRKVRMDVSWAVFKSGSFF